ncbi:hypothetical protein EBT25_18230 [bacterium]|nr:hypothetical protein [bacterium]
MPRKAINKIEDTREYQLAYLFWQKFKKSKSCLQFRVAWKIPHEGFSSREEYKVWEGDLFKKTNERFESAEYKELIAQRDQMRIRVAEGKASQSDFLVFAYSIEETIPLDKYRMDIAHLMNFWDQPHGHGLVMLPYPSGSRFLAEPCNQKAVDFAVLAVYKSLHCPAHHLAF